MRTSAPAHPKGCCCLKSKVLSLSEHLKHANTRSLKVANSRSLSPFSFLCRHCSRVRKCLAILHKHPCSFLHSCLLAQKRSNVFLRCLINDILQLVMAFFCFVVIFDDVGAYASTTVMLKGTALRWMVISLLETG